MSETCSCTIDNFLKTSLAGVDGQAQTDSGMLCFGFFFFFFLTCFTKKDVAGPSIEVLKASDYDQNMTCFREWMQDVCLTEYIMGFSYFRDCFVVENASIFQILFFFLFLNHNANQLKCCCNNLTISHTHRIDPLRPVLLYSSHHVFIRCICHSHHSPSVEMRRFFLSLSSISFFGCSMFALWGFLAIFCTSWGETEQVKEETCTYNLQEV